MGGRHDHSWWTGAAEVLPQTSRRGPGVQSLLGELVGQTAWSGVGSPSMLGKRRERGGPSREALARQGWGLRTLGSHARDVLQPPRSSFCSGLVWGAGRAPRSSGSGRLHSGVGAPGRPSGILEAFGEGTAWGRPQSDKWTRPPETWGSPGSEVWTACPHLGLPLGLGAPLVRFLWLLALGDRTLFRGDSLTRAVLTFLKSATLRNPVPPSS